MPALSTPPYYHHVPAEPYGELWKARCGAFCWSFDSVKTVRGLYVPCPDCPPDTGELRIDWPDQS